MFEGLKESLGSFRDDVEEEAEVEADDADAEGQPDAEEPADPEEQPDAEAEATAGTPAEGETDDGEGGAAAAETDGRREDGDGGSPGLAERAKSVATGKVYIDEGDLEGPLRELELALLSNDVAMDVVDDLEDRLREELVGEQRGITTGTGSVVDEALREALVDVLSVGQFDFVERLQAADKPVVVVFTGVNGVGKTTTIAKLSELLADAGLSSVLANGDTYRAGANEQIREHAAALDRKLIAHDQGGDPAAVLYDAVEYAEANDVDVVLGDTAGRLHTSDDLMSQLAKIDRVVDPDLTIFVDEAVAGQDAVTRAQEFDDAAEIDGAVLTKADADSSGGAAISVAQVTGEPVLFLGTGQGYDDIERFDPEAMVDRLLGE
jgi:fused signal recognition particle receptor